MATLERIQTKVLTSAETDAKRVLVQFGEHWVSALEKGVFGYHDFYRQSERMYPMISDQEKANGLSIVTFRELLTSSTGGDMESFTVRELKQESADRVSSQSVALLSRAQIGVDSLSLVLPFPVIREGANWRINFLAGMSGMEAHLNLRSL